VFVAPRMVDRCVATLRAKIDVNSGRQPFIETIRDFGYRFDPPPADGPSSK
jgi:DNA-binding response OmpR family regulator